MGTNENYDRKVCKFRVFLCCRPFSFQPSAQISDLLTVDLCLSEYFSENNSFFGIKEKCGIMFPRSSSDV